MGVTPPERSAPAGGTRGITDAAGRRRTGRRKGAHEVRGLVRRLALTVAAKSSWSRVSSMVLSTLTSILAGPPEAGMTMD